MKERRGRRVISGILWWIVGMGQVVLGQEGGGAIVGRVLDGHGKLVSGVQVQLISRGGGIASGALTDGDGSFRFEKVAAGSYTVRAWGEGFARSSREVKLGVGEVLSIDLNLSPEKIVEEVVILSATIGGLTDEGRRVPGSIQVIDRKTLEESRVLTVNEALRKAPGVHARDEEGFGLRPNLGIRGLNPTRSSKVLLLEDGIPLAYAPYGDNASYYHPPIDRFDGIEILKGSGQILYGPSTVGGVINYLTPNPPTKATGAVTLLGGNRRFFNGGISFGGTWNRTGLILHYHRKQGDGSRENMHAALNDVNLKVQQTLTGKQALTLKANYYGEDSNVTYSGLREAEFLANPRGNPFRNDFFYGDRWGGAATHAYVFNANVALTTNLYAMHFDRRWWRQSSNSAQRPNDAADPLCGGMANLNTTCGNEGRLRQYFNWGIEPRLRANFGWLGMRHELDLGGRYHYEHQDRRQENGETPAARSGRLVENNIRRNEAFSSFVQNRFQIGRFSITPGLRMEKVDFLRGNRLANNGQGVTGETDLTQLVPGIGFSYSPGGNLIVFGGIHRGFAPPRTEDIINNATGGTIDLDPELSWNYEVGMRAQFNGSTRAEATFFRMDYSNQIIPASLAGGVGATLTNGGRTLHQGAEASVRLDTATWFGSRYQFFSTMAYTWLPVAEFRGLRFSNISGFSTSPITGNRVPYAPENLFNINLGYAHSCGITALIEAVYTGAQFADDLNTVQPTPDGQRGLIEANTIWNATVNYEVESIRSTFFFTVKNLFDRLTVVDRARGVLPGIPRLFQAGLKFRF